MRYTFSENAVVSHRVTFGFRLLVIIGDFYVMRVVALPNKANPELIVDPNAVLTASVALQFLKPISGKQCQILQFGGAIQHG